MNIILGAGKMGLEIAEKYFSEDNVVFYDNDRRKWNKTEIVGGTHKIPVIDLKRFMMLIQQGEAKIIIGTCYKSALWFLKDVCLPDTPVFRVEESGLTPFSLDGLDEYQGPNSVEMEQKKLEACIEAAKKYEGKNESAYRHALAYIDFKKAHLLMPELTGIELTNYCNLRCPNCPTPTTKYPRGFLSDETFELMMKLIPPYIQGYFSLHGLGEPLLHPKFLSYVERLVLIDVPLLISSNGILMDEVLFRELLPLLERTKRTILYISFHTRKSVENWVNCLKWVKAESRVIFEGRVLEHNKEQVYGWLKEFGVDHPETHPHIGQITSHSWAGNVPGRRSNYLDVEIANRIRNCSILQNRFIEVRWDGKVKTCCYDSEGTGDCGTIFDVDNIRLDPRGYEICRHCDPDWTSGFQ